MSTFAFTQSVASCASLKSVRGKSAPKARRGAMQVRAANLMDTCRSSGLTQFADAVEKAGLAGEINGGSFTVFAPSNDAMSAFTNPDGTHSTADILKYHCIKGKIASKHSKFYLRRGDFFTNSFEDDMPPPRVYPALSASRDHSVLTNLSSTQTHPVTNYPLIMTLEGTKIAIDTKTTPGKIEVGAPEQGTQGLAGRVDGGFVTQTDIDADNGVIHVIDGVASPKVPLIGQNGGYVAGTEPGSGEGRTGLDTKVSSGGGGGGW